MKHLLTALWSFVAMLVVGLGIAYKAWDDVVTDTFTTTVTRQATFHDHQGYLLEAVGSSLLLSLVVYVASRLMDSE